MLTLLEEKIESSLKNYSTVIGLSILIQIIFPNRNLFEIINSTSRIPRIEIGLENLIDK